jgi:hypothetical protein
MTVSPGMAAPPASSQNFTSLAAGTSAVSDGAVLDNGCLRNNHLLVVKVGAAAPTNGVVQLEVSNDQVNWLWIANVTPTTANQLVDAYVTGVPARYVRASVTTVFNTGTVTAWVVSN